MHTLDLILAPIAYAAYPRLIHTLDRSILYVHVCIIISSHSFSFLLVIQYYLMQGPTLEEVDGLLAFIVASKDTHLVSITSCFVQ